MAGELGRLATGRIFLRMIRETNLRIHASVQGTPAMSKGSSLFLWHFDAILMVTRATPGGCGDFRRTNVTQWRLSSGGASLQAFPKRKLRPPGRAFAKDILVTHEPRSRDDAGAVRGAFFGLPYFQVERRSRRCGRVDRRAGDRSGLLPHDPDAKPGGFSVGQSFHVVGFSGALYRTDFWTGLSEYRPARNPAGIGAIDPSELGPGRPGRGPGDGGRGLHRGFQRLCHLPGDDPRPCGPGLRWAFRVLQLSGLFFLDAAVQQPLYRADDLERRQPCSHSRNRS